MTDQDSFDITDSTDWLSTPLSGLAPVESALRCQVCKDFYKTPMLTSCQHTFCSVCIRRALANDGKCPLCRASEQELKLRSNWSMEEVVAAFVKARAQVLEYAHKPPTVVASGSESPKRRHTMHDAPEEQRGSKRLRTSARLSATKGALATAEIARQEADISAPAEEVEEMEFDDGLVACPICLIRMKEFQVDKHLDKSCPGSPQPQPHRLSTPHTSAASTSASSGFQSLSSKQTVTKPPDRLPAINYSMLKEPQLRKKLAELGISTIGSRQILEKRHREWMTIWNANCDSMQPRRKGELLHDLEVWERTLGTRAPTQSRSINLGAQIKDKDFDHKGWSSQHDASFKDLIANARKNRAAAQAKAGQDEAVIKNAPNESISADEAPSLNSVQHIAPVPRVALQKDSSVHGNLGEEENISTLDSLPANLQATKSDLVDLTSPASDTVRFG
ncbi:hypothetical protein BX600DRAFT_447272 [Xylariales sp. PMI_506]|nr:hypothetical protein BX600DRAFT_447272 [Xylariales sp. PMI_506]